MSNYLKYGDVAAMFAVDTNTVRGWVRAKKLQPIRLGWRTVRFDPVEVNRFATDMIGSDALPKREAS